MSVHNGFRWPTAVAGILVCCAVAGCTATASARPLHGWSLGLPHVITGDRNGRRTAELDVVSGASTVLVTAGTRFDQLYEAATPPDADVAPVTVVNGDVVQLSLASVDRHGPSSVRISLDADVDWRIRLDGGAVVETVDMAGGRLSGLDFGAGSTSIDATLPTPAGTVPVTMSGGASTMRVHLPDGVPAQVRFAGGAGSATVDGRSRSGIAGGTVVTVADWTGSANRYDIDAAGVATLTLDRV
jgi:hypothetical protein